MQRVAWAEKLLDGDNLNLWELPVVGHLASWLPFGTRPTLNAALRHDCFVDALVIFAEDRFYRQAALGIATFYETLRVLAHPLLHVSARDAGIIAAVGAAQNVDGSALCQNLRPFILGLHQRTRRAFCLLALVLRALRGLLRMGALGGPQRQLWHPHHKDFPLQRYPARLKHAGANEFAQGFEIGGSGFATIDQKIAMQL